jgi:MYXO-CTERM domain-containing protein
MRTIAALMILIGCLVPSSQAVANVCGPVPQTLILLDRSGSMKELVGGQSKWGIATGAVNTLTGNFNGQLDFGLMLFSRWPHVSNCSSGKVNVGVGPNQGGPISGTLSSAYPQGDTPIALSLDAARSYMQTIKGSRPQYVILVTDGKETCQPASVNSPELAAGKLMGAGIKTYVVGFGSGVDAGSLNKTAGSGGTGSYYQANNLGQLDAALKKIAAAISCCGDGKLDVGEKCDTAISPGQNGACPTACNDFNPCTTDFLLGNACSVTCSYNVVTTPKNGDGCCPPGANSATDSDCAASCGNNVLDPGEKCDTGIPAGQWGGCPTTCDDKNPCTQDSLVGSGCQASCTNKGTCPTAKCGDGKLDPGEWCDTAIAAGKPGACPTSCDDGKKCTKDIMMGTACLAKCSNIPITQARNGDGCCVPGSNSGTDNDCPKSCGNGVLDAGEACDPQIKSGPGVCNSKCGDQNPCTKDFLGGSACDPKCMHSPIGPNPAKKDGCCPQGATDKQDADCMPPCGPDKDENCKDPCEGVKCPDGNYCKLGKCIPWPATDPNDPTKEGPNGLGDYGAEGGCDCKVSGDGAAAPLTTLALLSLLLVLRRRRRR